MNPLGCRLMIGQAANVACSLTNNSVTGVILTKIDRGYPWWCGQHYLSKSDYWETIKFTGTGEKITDIEPSTRPYVWPDPRYGDVLTLSEEAPRVREKRSLELSTLRCEKMRENTTRFRV